MGEDDLSRALAEATSAEDGLEAARTSDRMFVRSIDQLAEHSPQACGHRLTAYEALSAYGRDVVLEAVSKGAALLCESASAAGRVLRERRELLNLSHRDIAASADVTVRVIEDVEKSKRLPVRHYEKVARALGLDERYVSVKAEPVGNERLAVRLRRIGDDDPKMTAPAVSAIAEAAWVALTQTRLEEQLGTTPARPVIEPSPNYGSPGYPAYLHGYYLAHDARERLGLGTGPLPKYLRELCEEALGIPVIQAELGEHIAGVTVGVGKRRAIVVNVTGRNRHVYVRRSTIAHELGHLLYDDEAELRDLHVDEYEDLERPAQQLPDRVEQRANAFSIAFLAPQDAVAETYQRVSGDRVAVVMSAFGVSYTAARYQLWNALERRVPIDSLVSEKRVPEPSFESGEAYTADYHPLRGIPVSRAGRFSAIVVRAAQERVVSWQTASEWLCCTEAELRAASAAIRELFPSVFLVWGERQDSPSRRHGARGDTAKARGKAIRQVPEELHPEARRVVRKRRKTN